MGHNEDFFLVFKKYEDLLQDSEILIDYIYEIYKKVGRNLSSKDEFDDFCQDGVINILFCKKQYILLKIKEGEIANSKELIRLLYKIAKNNRVNYFRKKSQKKEECIDSHSLESNSPIPVENLISKEEEERLRAAIEKISSPRCRAVVKARLKGLSYEDMLKSSEILKVFEVPKGKLSKDSVRKAYQRGIEELKINLGRKVKNE